jgi:HEAT repeat protein/predicted Ser/Thr protein kinase
MSENANPKCPQCGAEMPGAAAGRVCPRCAAAFLKGEPTEIPGGTTGSPRPFTPPPVAELAPLFPQLEILELIGQGGMGAVYKARQKELDRIVALKILPPGVGGADFAERFAREAKALARLNHPGIVTLYEFGRSNGLFFFLMEYVDGATLRQVLQGGRISPREALAIVPAICDALQYAHDQGIVHRDIKPENILLDRRGRTKVADFGLAKLMGNGGTVSDVDSGATTSASAATQASKVMGTPQYMAPEQIEHPGTVDHRADIYALGVVFYQMLTGEMPGQRVEGPSTKVRIDVRLDEVVLRALEKNPDRRYGQASQIKTAVETIAATEKQPGAAEPGTIGARSKLPAAPVGESSDRAARILALERNIVLPVRLVLIVALGYYAFFAGWFSVPGASSGSDWVQRNAPVLRGGFIAYALVNLVLGAILIWGKRLTLARIVWVVFAAGVLDCMLMATLTFVCEPSGFDTKLYAVFAVLILHNAIAIPAAFPQLLLNFLTIVSFIAGGILDTAINPRPPFLDVESILHENAVERVIVLIIWALCCWGIQMLVEKRRRVEAEVAGAGRASSASQQTEAPKSPGRGWKAAGVLVAAMLVCSLWWAYRASVARWAEKEAMKSRALQRIEAKTAREGAGQEAAKTIEWLRIQPLNGWIADLQNSDEKARKLAELAMTEMGTNTLAEILKILGETNESPADDTRRFNTAQALKFMGAGARSGLPAFTALMESGQFPAGYSGARALAFSAPAVPEAFSILTNGLKDASAGVRVAASHGVGLCFNTETNNYAEPALPLLLSNLTDKDKDVRLATANALMLYAQHQSSHFPPLDAKADLLIPPLIELLRDKYSYVRETATYTLVDACFRDGLKPWIPTIQKLLRDPDEAARRSAGDLLRRLNLYPDTNVTQVVGAAPVFSVQATGTNPLSYQWYFIPTNEAGTTNGPQK